MQAFLKGNDFAYRGRRWRLLAMAVRGGQLLPRHGVERLPDQQERVDADVIGQNSVVMKWLQ